MVPARVVSGAFVALNAVHVALATGSQDAVGLQTEYLHDIYQVPVKRKVDCKLRLKLNACTTIVMHAKELRKPNLNFTGPRILRIERELVFRHF